MGACGRAAAPKEAHASRYLSPRPLGSSGMDVSALSLGSWRTFERLPPETGVAILRAAATRASPSSTTPATTTRRARPRSRPVLRGAVRELFRGAGLRRDETIVANKLWWEFWPGQSAAAELDASLQRMRFDHVDLIYANPPPAAWRSPTWWPRWRARRRREGPRVGPGELARRSLRPGGRGGRGPRDRTALRGPAALQPGAAVLGRGRRHEAGGHAGGRRGRRLVLPGGRRVDRQVPVGCRGGPLAGTLTEPRYARPSRRPASGLAASLHTTAAALALAFPFTNPDVASVLFGATSAEQLRANCAAAALWERLGPDDVAALLRIGLPAGTGPL